MNDPESAKDDFHILLVEDNPADIVLAMEVFAEISSSVRIHGITTGLDALDFLRKQDSFRDAPDAELVLLDLNLPGMDGRQVLQEIKSDPALLRLPVIVLTSSQSEEDRQTAYGLHANAFMLKAATLDGAMEVARAILDYWSRMVLLPPQ